MPSFEIVELDAQGKPRPFPAGVFPDGATAATVLASLKARFPDKKLQPRPLKDETNDWKVREQHRLDEGVYQPLGWNLKPVRDHYAYRAIKEPNNVAFTYSDHEGRVDKQRSVHVNTYLLTYYPDLSTDERRKLVWEFCGINPTEGFSITQDANTIRFVYENGPRSCMSGKASDYYCSPRHPAEAYAGPDLAVAYIKENDRVVARTVVYPEKKIYCMSIYGDHAKLQTALDLNGYLPSESSSDWVGARLTTEYFNTIDEDDDPIDGYMCPYLDFAWEYLVVVDGWSGKHYLDAERASGLAMY